MCAVVLHFIPNQHFVCTTDRLLCLLLSAPAMELMIRHLCTFRSLNLSPLRQNINNNAFEWPQIERNIYTCWARTTLRKQSKAIQRRWRHTRSRLDFTRPIHSQRRQTFKYVNRLLNFYECAYTHTRCVCIVCTNATWLMSNNKSAQVSGLTSRFIEKGSYTTHIWMRCRSVCKGIKMAHLTHSLSHTLSLSRNFGAMPTLGWVNGCLSFWEGETGLRANQLAWTKLTMGKSV